MIMSSVLYAEKSLHYTFNRMGSANLYNRVRRIVTGLVCEAAFKHLLDLHSVQYDLLGRTHWTKKDRYDVGISGHRFDVKGCHIEGDSRVNAVLEDPAWLLDCSALVPSDQLKASSLKDGDFYVFPFLTGEMERNTLSDYHSTDRYRYFVHCFWGYGWIKNPSWSSKGKLIIISECDQEVHLRIGGQGSNMELIVEEFILQPNSTMITSNEFYTVLFLQTNEFPLGSITVKISKIPDIETISMADWGNIWLYNGIVYFTGFLSKHDFRSHSVEIPRFYKNCLQYPETKTVNQSVPIKELMPLSILFK
jgi:hypothetical protein